MKWCSFASKVSDPSVQIQLGSSPLPWVTTLNLITFNQKGARKSQSNFFSKFWCEAHLSSSLLNTNILLFQSRECYLPEMFTANLASVLRFLGQKLEVTPRGNTLLSKEIKLCWQKYERLKSWCLEKEDKEWYLGIYLKVWVCAQELPKFRRVWESFKQFVAGLCRIFIMFSPDSRDH